MNSNSVFSRLAPWCVALLALGFGAMGWLRPPLNEPHRNQALAQRENNAPAEGVEAGRPTPRDDRPQEKKDWRGENAAKPSSAPTSEESTVVPSFSEPVASHPTDRGDGKLTGTVLDFQRKPAAGAVVQLRRASLSDDWPDLYETDFVKRRENVRKYLEADETQSRTIKTGADGRFSFTSLSESERYRLTVKGADGERAERRNLVTGEDIVIWLERSQRVVGYVKDPEGKPITEFKAMLQEKQENMSSMNNDRFSNEEGRFEFNYNADMRTAVAVSARGYVSSDWIEVKPSVRGAVVEVILEKAPILECYVLDSKGKPIAGARLCPAKVAAKSSSESPDFDDYDELDTYTDSRGRTSFDTLAPGEYEVGAYFGHFSESKRVMLSGGSARLDFVLEAGLTLTVSVRTKDGEPVRARNVHLMLGDSDSRASQNVNSEPGCYRFSGIKAGAYTILVQAAGYPIVRRKVQLSDPATTVDLELEAGSAIKGRITDLAGLAVKDVTVRVFSSAKSDDVRWRQPRDVRPDKDGNYRIESLEAGDWDVHVYTPDYSQSLASRRISAAGSDLVVDFSVSCGATLRVIVRDENGRPLEYASVSLSQSGSARSAETDEQGTGMMRFLRAGEYTVTATHDELEALPQRVTIGDGETELVLTLKRPNCVRVEGVTAGSKGEKAGLKEGDLIVGYNGKPVTSREDLLKYTQEAINEAQVNIEILRDGECKTLTIGGGVMGIQCSSAVR